MSNWIGDYEDLRNYPPGFWEAAIPPSRGRDRYRSPRRRPRRHHSSGRERFQGLDLDRAPFRAQSPARRNPRDLHNLGNVPAGFWDPVAIPARGRGEVPPLGRARPQGPTRGGHRGARVHGFNNLNGRNDEMEPVVNPQNFGRAGRRLGDRAPDRYRDPVRARSPIRGANHGRRRDPDLRHREDVDRHRGRGAEDDFMVELERQFGGFGIGPRSPYPIVDEDEYFDYFHGYFDALEGRGPQDRDRGHVGYRRHGPERHPGRRPPPPGFMQNRSRSLFLEGMMAGHPMGPIRGMRRDDFLSAVDFFGDPFDDDDDNDDFLSGTPPHVEYRGQNAPRHRLRNNDILVGGRPLDIREVDHLRPNAGVRVVPAGQAINVADYCNPVHNPAGDAECAICMDGHSAQHPLIATKVCGHTFHANCLDEWVNSTANNSAGCPTCRQPICPERPLVAVDRQGGEAPVRRVPAPRGNRY
ncbi:hypothetical protein K504DRAFT_458616 [Pleomassaria siparia CBS 279.74]|uniref:RING-type domain-containing protein n=1 Tax=Pleomassaria siparia CBS 279.74 TaxID=1314801 RepID=A0A6G1K2S0_9PLEO|nr:hypothetical protein K504DRAFT_458616 [Pleomassaria siparia CBS 279.74]